jgi:hypothetical protein
MTIAAFSNRASTQIHTYIQTYIHAYIHTYIHTYIYTRTQNIVKDDDRGFFGEGTHGHQRLPVSGLPAPRSYDNLDPTLENYFKTN